MNINAIDAKNLFDHMPTAPVKPVADPIKPIQAKPEPEAPKQQVSSEQQVAEMKRVIMGAGKDLRFDMDEKTKQVVVQVVDSQSGEVIKQLKALKLPTPNPDMGGLLFDKRS